MADKWLAELLSKLAKAQQRVLLRLSGEEHWALNWLNAELSNVIEAQPTLKVLRFGQLEAQGRSYEQIQDLRLKQYKQWLGQECDILIFNAYQGFNPDALGALSGTIRAGGLCILITPEDQAWPAYPDPERTKLCVEPYRPEQVGNGYLRRLVNILKQDTTHIHLSQSRLASRNAPQLCLTTLLPSFPPQTSNLEPWPFGCANEEQVTAVRHITKLFADKGTNAFVLSADRGRGKSAALGLAAAELMRQASTQARAIQILVTCPTPDSVATLFRHAAERLRSSCDEVSVSTHDIKLGLARLRFVATDALSLTLPYADLVLVDEAAAIPQALLQPAITHYDKLVFATTIHGYEGTGRGFEHKLKPAIAARFSLVEQCHLNTPIRFRRDDKLEPLINRLLGIDIDLPPLKCAYSDPKALQLKRYSKAELVEQPAELSQVFSLMVNAHYRTSPSDLRTLLEGPNIQVLGLKQGDTLLAAALVAIEGDLPETLCEQIWQGRRRPRGHLLPQSLMAHAGFKQAGQFRFARIIRIAVRPELQGQGIGSVLLSHLAQWYQQDGLDFLGSSFGASTELVRFWQKNGFEPIRLGLKPEASSGEISVMVAKLLNSNCEPFFHQVTKRFWHNLAIEHHLQVRDERRNLGLAIPELNSKVVAIQTQDRLDAECFANHFRTFDSCIAAIYRLHLEFPNKAQIPLLQDRLESKLKKSQLIKKHHLAGDKAYVSRLRAETEKLTL